MTRVLTVATTNAHKLVELRRLLADTSEVRGLDSLEPQPPPVDETGETFRENAILKAVETSLATTGLVLADDSGLCVDALGGRPGILSARHGGPGLTDRERYELVLEELVDVPDEQRSAHYGAAVALAEGGSLIACTEGRCDGRILREPRGSGGFGYDPIFWIDDLGKSMAQLTAEEKDRVSHRAAALRPLRDVLPA